MMLAGLSKKTLLMLFIMLSASYVLLVDFCVASETKPAKPTFTIEYPDEYAQYYLKIKNQPFTPYTNNDGAIINLYYQARYKDPSGDEWWFINYSPGEYVKQIESQEYSIITIGMRDGQKIDVQVRALVGTITWVPNYISIYGYYTFEGVEGDWSNTQTIMLNQQTFLPTLVPSPNTSYPSITQDPLSSNQPNVDNSGLFGFALWVGVVVGVVLLVIIAVILWRKSVSQFNSFLNKSVVDG
ncbi:MAG: hypothetical protein LBC03_00245 [Nitrososphaerota archaeon]|jgi:hypothetical protein|nr:hypothetical protein [Nitrososphaerota archaeon]